MFAVGCNKVFDGPFVVIWDLLVRVNSSPLAGAEFFIVVDLIWIEIEHDLGMNIL